MVGYIAASSVYGYIRLVYAVDIGIGQYDGNGIAVTANRTPSDSAFTV